MLEPPAHTWKRAIAHSMTLGHGVRVRVSGAAPRRYSSYRRSPAGSSVVALLRKASVRAAGPSMASSYVLS